MFLWAQQKQTHGTPGRDMWTLHGARVSGGQQAWVSANPVGLSQRQSGGHESAAIRRAWVSGDPAGIESEAGRRALSQRRAGGVISREWRAWGSGNPGTSRRAWESHRQRRTSPAIGGHEGSRPKDLRHSRRSRRTPTPTCSGLRQDDERRLPCRGTDKQKQSKILSKTENKTGWMGAAYG